MRCSPSAGDGVRHFPGVFFEMPQRPRGRWRRLPSDGGGTQALGGWAAVWSPDAADSPPLEFPRPKSHLEARWGLPSALHEGIRAAPRSSAQAHAYVRRRTGAHAHTRTHMHTHARSRGDTGNPMGAMGTVSALWRWCLRRMRTSKHMKTYTLSPRDSLYVSRGYPMKGEDTGMSSSMDFK